MTRSSHFWDFTQYSELSLILHNRHGNGNTMIPMTTQPSLPVTGRQSCIPPRPPSPKTICHSRLSLPAFPAAAATGPGSAKVPAGTVCHCTPSERTSHRRRKASPQTGTFDHRDEDGQSRSSSLKPSEPTRLTQAAQATQTNQATQT